MEIGEGLDKDALPFQSIHRIKVTACIPYHYRWKINECKLMLLDLKFMHEKLGIKNALILYQIVEAEVEDIFEKMYQDIGHLRLKRKELSESSEGRLEE